MGHVALAAMERTGQRTIQVQVPSQIAEQQSMFWSLFSWDYIGLSVGWTGCILRMTNQLSKPSSASVGPPPTNPFFHQARLRGLFGPAHSLCHFDFCGACACLLTGSTPNLAPERSQRAFSSIQLSCQPCACSV